MKRFGNIVVSPTNNWKRMHGFPVSHTKRYPHERKWLTKLARVKYHAMKEAGCNDDLIFRYMAMDYGDTIAEYIVYGSRMFKK